MKKTILITWWLWYIWSHWVVAFEKAWYKTVIVDNLVNSSKKTLSGINSILWYMPEFFECDLRDRVKLEEIFKKYDFDWVIHFAWLKAFWESTTYPYMYFDNNIYGTMILLDVMDRYWVSNIVFSSSASVYDGSNIPPFTENMKLWTTNPYATSKLVIEKMLEDYSKQKWFHSAILRYFNLIWAHESWNLWDLPRSNHWSLASNIFDVIFWKKQKLYIYWDTFPTPDGTAIRDYIDVNDLVNGHVLALEWALNQNKWAFDVWNLWTWKWLSVKELISLVENVTWKKVNCEVIPKRNIDLAIPISNPEKAFNDLHWKSKITVKESISNTWKFLQNNRKMVEKEWKKRVVHFTPYFPPHAGGLEMYALEWAQNYVKDWWKCLIATFSWWQKEKSISKDEYDIVVLPAFDIVHSFPFPKIWLPSFWIWLYKISKWKPEIIHTHTRFFLSSFIGWIFSKIISKPWIHIEHGSWFVVSSSKLVEKVSKLYDYTLWKWVLKNSDEIITVSEACEHFVYNVFNVKNIRTIYRWITPSVTNVTYNKNEINIWYVWRLVSLKWVDYLIKSFSDLIQKNTFNKKVILNIVWDWPERKNLENLTKNLWIIDNVKFLWILPVEKVRSEFLPSLDVFVNPSLQEWLPTTVIEALISWVSVVATDVWWTREILRHAQFLLVAPRSVKALSLSINQAILNLSNSTTKLPVSLFAWEQTFREFREVYNLFD